MSVVDLTGPIEVAARRMWRHATRDGAGGGINREDCDRLAKHAVMAAGPEIAKAVEAAVREQIAWDIEAYRERDWTWAEVMGTSLHDAISECLSIVRGDS